MLVKLEAGWIFPKNYAKESFYLIIPFPFTYYTPTSITIILLQKIKPILSYGLVKNYMLDVSG